MKHLLPVIASLLLVAPLMRATSAFAAPVETSTDAAFDPTAFPKLAIIVEGEEKSRASKEIQSNMQRYVEDEFLQVLLHKGYHVASRSDVQAIMKEQHFQKSGLTESDAASIGKVLNVPAVMVVKVTEFATERSSNHKRMAVRVSMGARLVGVESAGILWVGKQSVSSTVSGKTDSSEVVGGVCKAIASAFPGVKTTKKSEQPEDETSVPKSK